MIKLKVGADLDEDRRRLALARAAVGEDIRIAIDANQRWEVAEAVEWVEHSRITSRGGLKSRPAPTTSLGTLRSAKELSPCV